MARHCCRESESVVEACVWVATICVAVSFLVFCLSAAKVADRLGATPTRTLGMKVHDDAE